MRTEGRPRRPPLAALLLLALALGACATGPGGAGGDGPAGKPIQADFLRLADYLRRTHAGFAPEPLQAMSPEAFEALAAETWAELGGASGREEALLILSRFLARLEDGHTRVNGPPGPGAPLALWWFGDRLRVVGAFDEASAPLLHKELLSVGGMPVPELEAALNEYISADRGHLLAKREQSPALLLSRAFLSRLGLAGADGRVEIAYREGSEARTLALPLDAPARDPRPLALGRLRTEVTAPRPGNHYAELPEAGALYLQLNSIGGPPDAALYAKVFGLLRERGYGSLILDLRNNQGGNSAWCDEFLRYLLPEERRVYTYAGWASAYPGPNRRVSDGSRRLSPAPGGLGFRGRVLALVGPRTFSSATFFSVAIKDNGLGLVIGEPVGNANLRYGFMAEPIELPALGLRFATTHHVWGRALPGARLDEPYIEPDRLVRPSFEDFLEGRDAAMELALELAREGD